MKNLADNTNLMTFIFKIKITRKWKKKKQKLIRWISKRNWRPINKWYYCRITLRKSENIRSFSIRVRTKMSNAEKYSWQQSNTNITHISSLVTLYIYSEVEYEKDVSLHVNMYLSVICILITNRNLRILTVLTEYDRFNIKAYIYIHLSCIHQSRLPDKFMSQCLKL